jgi:predicted transcriptional regulator
MTKSKLETYVDTLDLLAHQGPLNLSHTTYKTNVTCSTHENCMTFLVKQGLIEERNVEMKSVLYAVTKRGINVLKFFEDHKKEILDTE